jgi:hypothetical protein
MVKAADQSAESGIERWVEELAEPIEPLRSWACLLFHYSFLSTIFLYAALVW